MTENNNKNGNKTHLTDCEAAAPGIESRLPPELLRAVLDRIDDPHVVEALQVSLMKISGSLPLPPPEFLGEWEKLYPGITGKFIEWTENESAHRRSLEVKEDNRFDRGQWIAASVALGGLALAAIVGIIGNPWVAGVIAIVAVGGPTAAVAMAVNSGTNFFYSTDSETMTKDDRNSSSQI